MENKKDSMAALFAQLSEDHQEYLLAQARALAQPDREETPASPEPRSQTKKTGHS